MAKPRPNSAELQAILNNLTGLTILELGLVSSRAATLMKALGGNPATESDLPPVSKDDWMLDGIYTAFKEAGRGFQLLPYHELVKTSGYKTYLRYGPNIRAELERKVPQMTPAERAYLGVVLGRLFLEYIFETAEQLTLSAVLFRIERYMPALENAFPGYYQSGMLRALLPRQQADVLVEV